MQRLKNARRSPTSVALEEEIRKELKEQAAEMGIPYQVPMRMLIKDGLIRMRASAKKKKGA